MLATIARWICAYPLRYALYTGVVTFAAVPIGWLSGWAALGWLALCALVRAVLVPWAVAAQNHCAEQHQLNRMVDHFLPLDPQDNPPGAGGAAGRRAPLRSAPPARAPGHWR